MDSIDRLSRTCRPFLQYALHVIPAAFLCGSGAALASSQNRHLLAVAFPTWCLSAAMVLFAAESILRATKMAQAAVFLVVLSTLTSLYERTEEDSLITLTGSWLRYCVHFSSIIMAFVAVAVAAPPNLSQQQEPPGEVKNLQARDEKANSEIHLLRKALSDVGSETFRNMGPGSVCSSYASGIVPELTLDPIGQAKSDILQKLFQYHAAFQMSALNNHEDDDSNHPEPEA